MKALKDYLTLLLHIILFIVAWLLFFVATVVNFVLVAIKHDATGYFRDSALRLDIYGCGEFRTLWNLIFIKKNGIKFKYDGNTISAYLGLNELLGHLTGFGKFISSLLNILDTKHERHCYSALLNSKLHDTYLYLIRAAEQHDRTFI